MGIGFVLKTFSFRRKMLAMVFILMVSLVLFVVTDRGGSFENAYSYKDVRNHVNVSSTGTVRDMKNTQVPILPSSIEDIQHERRSHLRQTCERLGAKKYSETVDSLDLHTLRKMDHIYVLDNYKTLFCYVPKAGCTSWKRVLLKLNGNINSTGEINQHFVHELAIKYLPTLHRLSLEQAMERLKHYNKFIFVREPFSRILSAFRDKFEVNIHRNDAIKRKFASILVDKATRLRNRGQGAKRVKVPTASGNQNGNVTVTFGNFVDYVSNSWNSLTLPAEEHWREMFRLCFPCDVPYDFIGHFETLDEDSRVSLQQITKKDSILFPKATYPTNSSDSTVFNRYYSQLSPSQLKSLHKRLETDIALFNYKIPAVIEQRMNISHTNNDHGQNPDKLEENHEHYSMSSKLAVK